MAAPSYTYNTVLDELKRAINDRRTDADEQWMTDSEYKAFIFRRFESNKNTTYIFSSRASGVWTYGTAGDRIWLYDMSFTGQNDAAYTVNSTGSIELTAGTDSSAQLTVSGTPVDFPELVIDVCQYLITHKAQESSVNIGGASFTPQDEQRIIRVMETWRGIKAV